MQKLIARALVKSNGRSITSGQVFTAPDQKTEKYLLSIGAAEVYREKNTSTSSTKPAQLSIGGAPSSAPNVGLEGGDDDGHGEDEGAESQAGEGSSAQASTTGTEELAGMTKAQLVQRAAQEELTIDGNLKVDQYRAELARGIAEKQANADLI